MKKTTFVGIATLTLGLLGVSLANADPNYAQTFTVGGTGYGMGHAVATDRNGNIFYAGHVQGASTEQIDVNPTAGTDNRTTTAGSADALLTKINKNGTYAWSRLVGGSSFDRGSSAVTDNTGNIYLMGNFSGNVNFNPGGTADYHQSANSGSEYDNYVTKINANGSYGWTRVLGGYTYIFGRTLDVDSQGNVYATGAFSIPQDFAMEGAGDWRTPVAGTDDIFLTKINANGTYAWTYTMGNTGYDMGHSVTVDESDNVFFTGHFQGTVDLNPTSGVTNFSSRSGSVDAYIIKFDANDNYQWTQTFGGTGWDGTYNIDHDAFGNLYVSGLFSGTADLNPTAGVNNYTAKGVYDLYVTKINSLGQYAWSKTLGAPGFDFGVSGYTGGAMAVDYVGNVYLGRCFANSMDFNPGVGDVRTAQGAVDGFVTKYSSTGAYEWTHTMSGASNICVNALTTDFYGGNMYATGNFEGTANFNPSGVADNKTSAGNKDIFVSVFTNSATNYVYEWKNTAAGHRIRGDAKCYSKTGLGAARVGQSTGTTYWDPNFTGFKPSGYWWTWVQSWIYNNGWQAQSWLNSGWVLDAPAVVVSPEYTINSWFGAWTYGWRSENGVMSESGRVYSSSCS